jgi:hypothetical protein
MRANRKSGYAACTVTFPSLFAPGHAATAFVKLTDGAGSWDVAPIRIVMGR